MMADEELSVLCDRFSNDEIETEGLNRIYFHDTGRTREDSHHGCAICNRVRTDNDDHLYNTNEVNEENADIF